MTGLIHKLQKEVCVTAKTDSSSRSVNESKAKEAISCLFNGEDEAAFHAIIGRDNSLALSWSSKKFLMVHRIKLRLAHVKWRIFTWLYYMMAHHSVSSLVMHAGAACTHKTHHSNRLPWGTQRTRLSTGRNTLRRKPHWGRRVKW